MVGHANDKLTAAAAYWRPKRTVSRLSPYAKIEPTNTDTKVPITGRMNILGSLNDKFDVQMFQDLPVYVRMEILKGKVLFCRDISQLNDIAYSTILAYNLFEHSYKLYLGMSDY